MTPDGRWIARWVTAPVIPDMAARNREREGSSVRQPARHADDRDRGYGAFTTPAGRRMTPTSGQRPPAHSEALAEPRALSYFAVDEQYRMVVPRLRRPAASGRPIALETSDGQQRIARRVEFLDFDLHGQPHPDRVQYRADPTGVIVRAVRGYDERHRDLRERPLPRSRDRAGRVGRPGLQPRVPPVLRLLEGLLVPLTPAEHRLSVPILAGEWQPR